MAAWVDVDFSDLRRAAKEIAVELEQDAGRAMAATTAWAKQELRQQTLAAGLGPRLVKTWQDRLYPERRNSLEVAGFVYSRAPDLISAWVDGATIVPRNGRYLWIPTRAVPRGKRRRRMNPVEVAAHFGQKLIIRRMKSGKLGAFISKERGTKRGGGLRKVRKGRLGYGASGELVLMFTLVRSTKVRRVFDLDTVAERGAQLFADLMGRE